MELEGRDTEAEGPTGIFGALFGAGSRLLEFVVVLLLATLPEASALALISGYKPGKWNVPQSASESSAAADVVLPHGVRSRWSYG